LELWDTARCEKIKDVTSVSAEDVVFSPDGQLIATKNGFAVDVWDVKTGQVRFSATNTQFRSKIGTFAFSKDSKRLFTAKFERKDEVPQQQEYLFTVWDTETGERVNTIKSDIGFLGKIVAGTNKEIVAILNSSNTHFWNINSGKLLTTIPSRMFTFTNSGDAVWFVHDADEKAGLITLWDVFTGEKIREFQTLYSRIEAIFLSKDNARIALSVTGNGKDGDSIVILDAETGAEIYKSNPGTSFTEFSSTDTVFATCGDNNHIYLWDFQSGSPFRQIYGHYKMRGRPEVTGFRSGYERDTNGRNLDEQHCKESVA